MEVTLLSGPGQFTAAPGRLRCRGPSYAFRPRWQQCSNATGHYQLVELVAIVQRATSFTVRRELRLAWPPALAVGTQVIDAVLLTASVLGRLIDGQPPALLAADGAALLES